MALARTPSGQFVSLISPDEPRQCPDCGEVKPADDFHAKKRNADGSVKSRQTYCKECGRYRNRIEQRRRRGNAPRKRRRTENERRQRRRERYREIMADPERAAEYRRKQREQARRRLDRKRQDPMARETMYEPQKRYRERMLNDPEARALFRTNGRIDYRIKHEPTRSLSTAIEAYRRDREQVPSAPFLAWLKAAFPGESPERLEKRTGIAARRYRELLEANGNGAMNLETVDIAFTLGLGRPDLVAALYPVE